jgi:hypothetical protein
MAKKTSSKEPQPRYERAKTFTVPQLRSLADVMANALRRIRDEADVLQEQGISTVKVLHGTGLMEVIEDKLPDFLGDLEKKARKAVKHKQRQRRRDGG